MLHDLSSSDAALLASHGVSVDEIARDEELAETSEALHNQLVQTQRLDALAQMAGHVAHEYNNLLTTILGFSGLLQQSEHLTRDEQDNLGHIDDAARRAAELTRSLLSFSRGGLVSFGPLDLVRTVRDTVRLAEPSLGTGVVISVKTDARALIIEGDAGQVQQAILNLLLNARDALNGSGSVKVTLAAHDGFAELIVSDDGPGMDSETKRRAFEPFFSRKSSRHAAGLGLSITYGIVKGHGGSIDLDTIEGLGTTLTIRLPLATVAVEQPSAVTPRDGDLAIIAADDELTRVRAGQLASSLGLTPIYARDAEHAAQIVAARPHRFATAIAPPGYGGPASLFSARAEEKTGIPVLSVLAPA